MTTLIPIQRAAMLYVDQVRRLSEVGARSGFHSGLRERSSLEMTNSESEAEVTGISRASVFIATPVTRSAPCAAARAGRSTIDSSLAPRSVLQALPSSS